MGYIPIPSKLNQKVERIAKRFISPAFIAWLFCPPIGLGGLLNLWIAMSKIHNGDITSGIRSLKLAKSWIKVSIYVSLIVLLIASVVLYLMGPKLVPPMGSFY